MAARIWRIGTRRAYVYVEGRENAERALTAAGVTISPMRHRNGDASMLGAMAVYLDRRGKPFAWQIAFDVAHWDAVASAAEAV